MTSTSRGAFSSSISFMGLGSGLSTSRVFAMLGQTLGRGTSIFTFLYSGLLDGVVIAGGTAGGDFFAVTGTLAGEAGLARAGVGKGTDAPFEPQHVHAMMCG